MDEEKRDNLVYLFIKKSKEIEVDPSARNFQDRIELSIQLLELDVKEKKWSTVQMTCRSMEQDAYRMMRD